MCGKISKRDLFAELTTSLSEEKEHSEGKLTLKTHEVVMADELVISPNVILSIRENLICLVAYLLITCTHQCEH